MATVIILILIAFFFFFMFICCKKKAIKRKYQKFDSSALQNVNKVSCSLWRQQVVYWEDDTKPDTVGKVRISGNFTQVNVSGLRPSTAYYLSVAAFNTAGPGPQSPPINATTKEPRESTRSPRTPNPPPPAGGG